MASLYHGTELGALLRIAKWGLQPREGEIYLTPGPEYASSYTENPGGERAWLARPMRELKEAERVRRRGGQGYLQRLAAAQSRPRGVVLEVPEEEVLRRWAPRTVGNLLHENEFIVDRLEQQGWTPGQLSRAFSRRRASRSLALDVKAYRELKRLMAEPELRSTLGTLPEIVARKAIPPSVIRVRDVLRVPLPRSVHRALRGLPVRQAVKVLRAAGVGMLPALALVAGASYLAKRAGGTSDPREV